MRLRVMAYNVHGFKAGPGRVADTVRRFEPDLLILNESGGRWRLRRFGRASGMAVAADPWTPLRRRVKDAVLARPPWRVMEHRLHRFRGGPVLLPRGALVARLVTERLAVTAVATHLGLHPVERRRNALELTRLLGSVPGPLVLGGDLNDTPDGRAVSILADRWSDAWVAGSGAEDDEVGAGATFPARGATARIDYLFVSEDIRVDAAFVPEDAETLVASDHRPLVVDLTLSEPG
jgi:endonuclease/exonuclease/phosphatase family metal-dependent hydrolase